MPTMPLDFEDLGTSTAFSWQLAVTLWQHSAYSATDNVQAAASRATPSAPPAGSSCTCTGHHHHTANADRSRGLTEATSAQSATNRKVAKAKAKRAPVPQGDQAAVQVAKAAKLADQVQQKVKQCSLCGKTGEHLFTVPP